jgi:ABC-type antimicrobial peptide transport system permease subunit
VFVALFGLVGGLAVGAALSGLVVRLVTLTANPGETATVGGLPLRLDLDWRLVALAAAVLAVVASALVSLPTRRAFR